MYVNRQGEIKDECPNTSESEYNTIFGPRSAKVPSID